MIYYYLDIAPFEGKVQRHIIYVQNEVTVSFPATDDNPNMVEYLAWVAEGNTAEEWQPEEPVTEEQPIVEEPIAEEPVTEDAN